LNELAETALRDFEQVSKLARREFDLTSIKIQLLPAPHKPPSLPVGFIAVYSFFFNEQCLKVGKVGANSQARYLSQHYIAKSSRSNLARSLVASESWTTKHQISEMNVGSWIKTNTSRINLVMPEMIGLDVLALLEAFLHCRWAPEFEGKT